MSTLRDRNVPPSTNLLLRLLECPGLVAAVRELPGAVLGKLIDKIGLEDAGELVARASTAQLERVFDDDLWRAERAGGDERFRPERFVLWLRVMLEGGEELLVQRLCELPQDLLALVVHRLVLVLDMDLLAEQLAPADEEAEAIARARWRPRCSTATSRRHVTIGGWLKGSSVRRTRGHSSSSPDGAIGATGATRSRARIFAGSKDRRSTHLEGLVRLIQRRSGTRSCPPRPQPRPTFGRSPRC